MQEDYLQTNDTYKKKLRAYFDRLDVEWVPTKCWCGEILGLPAYGGANIDYGQLRIVECVKCKTHRQNPAPSEKSLFDFYQNSEAMKTWSQGKEGVEERIKLYFKYIPALTWLNINAGAGRHVLDIGGGNGLFGEWGRNFGFKTLNLELSPEAAAVYNKRNVPAIIMDAILFKPTFKYEVVSMWGNLEHLSDPNLMLVKIKEELLDSQGFVAICVPNIGSHAALKGRESTYTYAPPHLWYFTPKTLDSFMASHGFKKKFFYGLNYKSVCACDAKKYLNVTYPINIKTETLPDHLCYEIISIYQN